MADDTTAEAHEQPPRPNPALRRLGTLVGTWDVRGRESGPDGEIHGQVAFAWLEGGFYLVQRAALDRIGRTITGAEYIGYDEANSALKPYFFSNERGPAPSAGLPSSWCGRSATTPSRSGAGSWARGRTSRARSATTTTPFPAAGSGQVAD